jgi:ABC-type sulfate transport system permease component
MAYHSHDDLPALTATLVTSVTTVFIVVVLALPVSPVLTRIAGFRYPVRRFRCGSSF